MTLSFEWHDAKARVNASKHGVTFAEAASVFHDPLARIFDDPIHSYEERREIIVGHSKGDRLLLISFKQVGEARVRIISAREITRREQKKYEKFSGYNS